MKKLLIFFIVLQFCYFLLDDMFSFVDSFKQSFFEIYCIVSLLIATHSRHNLLMIYIIFKRSIWKNKSYLGIKSISIKVPFCILFDNLPKRIYSQQRWCLWQRWCLLIWYIITFITTPFYFIIHIGTTLKPV